MVIPSEFRGGMVFVRATVGGGAPGVFLLDTGAAATVLDARFAEAAGVKLGDPLRLLGGGGETSARQAEDVPLTLAGEPPQLIDPTVTDLGRVSRGMGVHLDGILGVDVLRRFVVTLDYRAGSLRLSAPDQAVPPGAVPMRLIATPFVMATVQAGGREQSAAFQIDTGSNTAVEFWAPFARGVFPEAPTTPVAGVGVAGRTESQRGRIDALLVAGQKIVAPEANFADRTRPDDAGPDYGGVIGGPAWSGLALTLDFPRRRVWAR